MERIHTTCSEHNINSFINNHQHFPPPTFIIAASLWIFKWKRQWKRQTRSSHPNPFRPSDPTPASRWTCNLIWPILCFLSKTKIPQIFHYGLCSFPTKVNWCLHILSRSWYLISIDSNWYGKNDYPSCPDCCQSLPFPQYIHRHTKESI